MNGQLGSLRRFLSANPRPHGRGPSHVLLVASGRGGAGTSTVATLLAMSGALEGRRTLILEANQNFGSLGLLLGAPERAGVEALRDGADVDDLVVPVTSELHLLSTAPDLADPGAAPGAVEHRMLMRRVASIFGRYDRVVVDAGSRRDEIVAAAEVGAGGLLAVSGSDRLALAATHALFKVVDARVPGMPFHVAFNRGDDEGVRAAFDVLREGAAHYLGRRVNLAGSLPEDVRLRAAIEAGAVLPIAAAESVLELAARDIADRLFDDSPARRRIARAPAVVQVEG